MMDVASRHLSQEYLDDLSHQETDSQEETTQLAVSQTRELPESPKKTSSYWAELEQALARLKIPQPAFPKLDTVIPEAYENTDVSVRPERDKTPNTDRLQPPKSLQNCSTQPVNISDQLVDIYSQIETQGDLFSRATKAKLGTAFALLENHLPPVPQPKAPLSTRKKSHNSDELSAALTHMASTVEDGSSDLSAKAIHEMALKVQTLATRLNKLQEHHSNKDNFGTLLKTFEKFTTQWTSGNAVVHDVQRHWTSNWQELNVWKQTIEQTLNAHQERVSNLLETVVVQRLDELAQKLFTMAEEKRLLVEPPIEAALENRMSLFEEQIDFLLQGLPQGQAAIAQKVDTLQERVDEVHAFLPQQNIMMGELRELIHSLKEKLAQITHLDASKQKDVLGTILSSISELKASNLASDHSVHAALRDLETHIRSLYETISREMPGISKTQNDETIGRLTTAIKKIQTAAQQEAHQKAAQLDPESNVLRAQLIEAARETPVPFYAEEQSTERNQAIDLDHGQDTDVLNALTDKIATMNENSKRADHVIRDDLENRIGVLKKIKGTLGKRWSS